MATTVARSLAPGASVAPGSFHDGSAASSHNSAASAFNNVRSTAPHLNNQAPSNASADASGTGRLAVSGKPASPGTQHTPISQSVNAAAAVFSPAGVLSTGYKALSGLLVPIGSGISPILGGNSDPAGAGLVAGHIPDNVHVVPQPVVPVSSGNSGGSTGGSSSPSSSPQDTLDSSNLGNLLYDLLGPASTGVTPGDAGLQVTPVTPTTSSTSPNVLVGLLALGVLAGIGWYYLKERKKGSAHGAAA